MMKDIENKNTTPESLMIQQYLKKMVDIEMNIVLWKYLLMH